MASVAKSELWIALQSMDMPYMTEVEMGMSILVSVNEQVAARDRLVPVDILSIQRIEPKNPMWIVYCANEKVKVTMLSVNTITVKEQQYELKDYTKTKVISAGRNGMRVPCMVFPLKEGSAGCLWSCIFVFFIAH